MRMCFFLLTQRAIGFGLFALFILAVGCADLTKPTDATQAPASESQDEKISGDKKESSEGDEVDEFLAGFEDEYGDLEEKPKPVSDPLKPWNVVWYEVNDRLYFWVIRPLGKGWAFIMPRPVRTGVDNFFDNITYPGRVINNLLQAKFRNSGIETARFLTNTTVGVLGFWDAADYFWELKPKKEDFDQTFAVWTVPSGWYIVWPFFGPSTLRGTVGMVCDRFADPMTYASQYHWGFRLASPVDLINSDSLEETSRLEQVKEMSVDPYPALRNAYLQSRREAISK
ncbi:MAG: VacJ family lipoprotein [Candidatus Sumerlaeia bacterium]